ncbi:MAG: hypothetical protein Sv326_0425 [Candidatus Fermentimicrarchaeum limneticum]|uniref:Uncharacterized protein n=1 Tax=Fermentimicrarchaeum limneticum TaxID=2795018 RepID=A0A7D5XL39_FERL1|nr:MAG: hypothetical protein Sv326_0351 [Candidatus Fermentimicrarchaeum limneticum]QLJ52563.1 MAG: hypothetical protein Sv326_0388 [Candidatus Fermentimicrarchaeum limneticum]QLJ52600.1 MAG: hypothetical protein Sv326_0425 [Candidatus Fermentimicrarchaeum limneticum]
MKICCWICGGEGSNYEIPRGKNPDHTIGVCKSCYEEWCDKVKILIKKGGLRP